MFKPATKAQIKIRLALSGASGSGKTFSSLAIASHLGGAMAVIDTERGSASRYADRFNFDVCELTDCHPSKYIEAIKAAEKAGYSTIIIDSLSHAWFAELELVDRNKNSFAGWKDVRPLERKLIDAIIGSQCHIIATMRAKTEWVLEETTNKFGKATTSPKKIGTTPVQSSGIEYEFDVAGELDHNHSLTISKSRCSELADKTFLNPGQDVADILKSWIAAPVQPALVPDFSPHPTTPAPRGITEPWERWKSLGDAINWAATQLGKDDVDMKALIHEFEKLPTSSDKKTRGAAWVARVKELAHDF